MAIIHADLNSFFANCVIADSKGKYTVDMSLIVCGDPQKRHGIVLAATYPVKRLGVCAGMPVTEAYTLCPDAVFVRPEYASYMDYSERFMAIVRRFSPLTMSYGIDEAYLQYGGSERIFGPAEMAAHILRESVKREIGLTISVGIGENPLMAKMGSDYKKPDGVTVVDFSNWRELMWPLPVGRLMFIGRATQRKLCDCGVYTIGDLARIGPRVLKSCFGNAMGTAMWEHANGMDTTRIEANDAPQKSVSCSSTLERDAEGAKALCGALLRQTEKAAYRMREKRMLTGLVKVHLRFSDLSYEAKQAALPLATSVTGEIYEAARQLALSISGGKAVRQVGVSLGKLTSAGEQLSFFSPERHLRMAGLDDAIDSLRGRYGFDAVKRLSTMGYVYTAKDDFTPFVRNSR